jgi:hypothetical protein
MLHLLILGPRSAQPRSEPIKPYISLTKPYLAAASVVAVVVTALVCCSCSLADECFGLMIVEDMVTQLK